MSVYRFSSLLMQDIAIVFRNGYVFVVIALAALFILLVNFILPEQLHTTGNELILDLTDEKIFSNALRSAGMEEKLLASELELQQALERDSQAVGIVFQGDRENPKATIYHQGNESEKTVRRLEAAVVDFWNTAGDLERQINHRVVLLRQASEKPPFNLSLVPLILGIESALIGLFFVSALVFQEKEEGSIRAFRVSPAGTWSYILSKITIFLFLSLLSGVLLFVFTLGLHSELLSVLLLVALVGILMTAFGLTISVFFNSLAEFIYVLAGIMAVISLPMASYFFPSINIAFIPLIPTYPLMFGIRELIFSTGKTGFYLPMLMILLVEIVLMLVITRVVVERKLMKEGY
jgi:hypothetical protein